VASVLGLRTLIALQRDRLGFLEESAARGDVVRTRLLAQPIVLLSRPETARAVLTTHQRAFSKSPVLQQARLVLGDGLLTAEGETHRRHRRLVQPAFHRRRLEGYARVMTEAAAAEAATWSPARPLDAHAALHRVALEITGRTLFGTDTRADAEEVRGCVDDLLSAYPTALLPFGSVVRRLPLPGVRRLHDGLARLDALVERLIRERREAAGSADGDGSDGAPGDLLSLLLAARDEEGGGLDDTEVRDEVVTLLLAGHETTAALLVWTLHLLAHHPDVQAAVHAEVDALVEEPTADDLDRLVRTRAVVAEALRLYPPSYAIARQAIEDVDVGLGARLAAGDVIIASPWVLHRDRRWWVQADRFAPERWDGVDPRRPQRAFLPFGAGTRMCVGEAFAWTEAVLVVATILRRWDLTATGPLPQPVASLTLRPGPPGGPIRGIWGRWHGSGWYGPRRRGRLPPMKPIDVAQRITLYLLTIPVVLVLLDAVFNAFDGEEDNPIVSTVRDAGELFTPEFTTTMFADQGFGQTALLTLAFYGVFALLIWLVFRLVRSAVAGRTKEEKS
jgi:cytochrome P450